MTFDALQLLAGTATGGAAAAGIIAAQLSAPLRCGWTIKLDELKTRLLALGAQAPSARRATVSIVALAALLAGGAVAAYAAVPSAPRSASPKAAGVVGASANPDKARPSVSPATTQIRRVAVKASVAMAPASPAPVELPMPPTWSQVGKAQYDALVLDRLPDDASVVTPIASPYQAPDPLLTAQLDRIEAKLDDWEPAKVADPVQRARNILYVAAVPDLMQIDPLERFLPDLVFAKLKSSFSAQDLPKILFWVAMNPDSGSDAAMGQLDQLGLNNLAPAGRAAARPRAMVYGLKLLGRLIGQIPT